ncbi:MAG: 3-hydroxyacyl-CoA dehydrogenase NAD-binding protein [Chloroflexi bacterium]|nr:3-hydroxyacyl-CoA dehydrogenase NAD-binding protein [Chloroflexota bacterium]
MDIKTVAVIGAGTMGNGIAQVVAQAGYNVIMTDIKDEFLAKGMSTIGGSLDRLIKKGTLQEADKTAILGRIKTTIDLKEARNAQLVIESAPEILDLKASIFKDLESICPPETILASNTSALPISAISTSIKRKDKVIGIHFMNPVPVMKGVEVIVSTSTSAETVEASKNFVKSLGKEPCEAKDYAGFIVSRLVDVLMNEAIQCVMDGNKPEEVDKAMRLCANHPIGPLELCDLAGADIVLHGLETMEKEFGERLKANPLLKSQVRSGALGRKTGRGFYDYTQPKK